jgi:2,4-dienoyl-CoA reductase-like NADH-dependent reductase (Old Yellow Enzyme family)
VSVDLLWEPIRLGTVEMPNRVFVSAHTTNFAEANRPTARHVAYHRERAEGGVGLIITEAVRVHPTSAGRASSLAAFSDDDVPAFADLVGAVHEGGARVFSQLAHLGRQASGDANRGCLGALAAVLGARIAYAARDDCS